MLHRNGIDNVSSHRATVASCHPNEIHNMVKKHWIIFSQALLCFFHFPDTEEQCTTLQVPDKAKYGGRYLSGYVYSYRQESHVSRCARVCKKQRMCKSFSFQTTTEMCSFNRESHVTRPGDMRKDNTGAVVYFSADDWPEVRNICLVFWTTLRVYIERLHLELE